MYGVFVLSKSQIKKLYKEHPSVRKGAEDNEVRIVIPDMPADADCTIIDSAGNHLGYIPFKAAWRL